MASTVNGFSSFNHTRKFYSNSIKSESTVMTEEDEDFNNFTNSSSFQTSTTNSSPVNAKLEAEELLLTQGFYSGPSLPSSAQNGKSHSNFIRRSMIQSPSFRNFNQDLYSAPYNKSISTIYESSPSTETTTNFETPTTHLGMTESPSMRALESILNQKTKSTASLKQIETIEEAEDDDPFSPIPPRPATNLHNNQSELSVASYHTAQSADSRNADYAEREGLLNDSSHYDYEEEVNDMNGLNSPGINSDPVKGLGLLSPNVLGKKFKQFEKELPASPVPDVTTYKYSSMLGAAEVKPTAQANERVVTRNNITRTASLQKPPFRKEIEEVTKPAEVQVKQTSEAKEAKKNRRKSFAGFFRGKKSNSSSDLLAPHIPQERPKQQETKSTPNAPLANYARSHVKSKSVSNLGTYSGEKDEKAQNLPRSKSNFFSAFKRGSKVAAPAPEQEQQLEQPLPPKREEFEKKPNEKRASDDNVLKEADLRKGHKKRNSILVPSPILDNQAFEEPSKSEMYKDLSFSASMMSSINHNYDIVNATDIEEKNEGEFDKDSDNEEASDEFNSSFNSIKQLYSNEDEQTKRPVTHLPRDISVGSFRMDFDDFQIDNYTSETYNLLSKDPVLSSRGAAQKAQHHKASSKIQNLLGEALFPRSLDMNEVASITTLERSRSMKSVRSGTGSSLRDSLRIDGMTVVKSPNSPMHEPHSTIISSPSSILKRRSIDYDDDLQEFANMIDFGDDDDDEGGMDDDFKLSMDLSLADYTFESDDPVIKKAAKPLPSVPIANGFYDGDDDDDDDMEEEEDDDYETPYNHSMRKDFDPVKSESEEETEETIRELQNPFDYPTYVKQEPLEDYVPQIKTEQAEFDFETNNHQDKQEEEEEDEEVDNQERETAHAYQEYDSYDDDDLSVKIKQEVDFDEDFNNYEYREPAAAVASPNMNAYIPAQEEAGTSKRPFSMSASGLKGPRFGETNNLVKSSASRHSMYMTLPKDDSNEGFQSSPSRLNLNEKILKDYYGNNATKKVAFSSRIILFDTYDEEEYDRHPEIATCNQLTPILAQQIREELNQLKSQMYVHESSKCFTQFF